MAELKMSGYEGIYKWVAAKLPGFDLAKNAAPLGLIDNGDGSVVVNFFNRDYIVEAAGARPADGRPAGINHLSLVAHYAMSPGRGEPLMDFVPLELLSGTVSGSWGGYKREGISTPLVRRFGADQAGLKAAIARLGGREEEQSPSGGRAWVFFPVPKVPLRLIYHEADDEFEAEFRILYDRRSIDFMEYEALGFLGGILVADLCRE